MTIVNYILGATPAIFNFENADTNKDGEINILDVMDVVNILLYGDWPFLLRVHASLRKDKDNDHRLETALAGGFFVFKDLKDYTAFSNNSANLSNY